MSDEEFKLFESYRIEVEKCFEIAQWMDAHKNSTPDAFLGTPSERIKRQLAASEEFAWVKQ